VGIIPTKSQWKKWSTPSKLTAIGTLVGILSLGVYLIEKTFGVVGQLYSSLQATTSLEQDFPIGFGDTRSFVHKQLGSPQEVATVWDTFYSDGLSVYYDRHTQEVDGFYAHLVKSGYSYPGTICGISIGNTIKTAREILGRPDAWGLTADAPMAVWKSNPNYLIATLYPKGHEKSGHIVSLTYCRESSFACYTAIFAGALQELRCGKLPGMLEDPSCPTISVDVNDTRFRLPYAIVSAHLSPIGGAEMVAKYADGSEIYTYIYPQGWITPRIRGLAWLDASGELLIDYTPDPNEINITEEEMERLFRAIEHVESGSDYMKNRNELTNRSK